MKKLKYFIMAFGICFGFGNLRVLHAGNENSAANKFEVSYEDVETALLNQDFSTARNLLEKMSDHQIVCWSKIADMDCNSTFRDFLSYSEYRERLMKLDNESFIDLMCNCKMWHGGIPMMHITNREDEVITRQFWNRIKQLPQDMRLQVLCANYFGENFMYFLKRDGHEQKLPKDIRDELYKDFESICPTSLKSILEIDALRLDATRGTNKFYSRVPSGYVHIKHYPQLLSQALCSKNSNEIDAVIDSVVSDNAIADRSVGSLMGLLIGDAIGAPLEFLPAQTETSFLFADLNKLKYASVHNGFDLKPGQWTDDGSMALCLADSLIVSGWGGEYDGSDCRIRYYLWWYTGYNNAFVYDDRRGSVGLGGNIAKSFNEISANPQNVPEVFNASGNDAGNGSIMRNAPVAIRFSSNISKGIEAAIKQSKGTHPGDDAAACCAFMTYITIKAIRKDQTQTDIKTFIDTTIASFFNEVASKQRENSGFKQLENVLKAQPSSKKEAVWNWKNDQPLIKETLTARGKTYNGYPVSAGYFGSYCMDGLAMALWALYHAKSFEDAIIKSVNLCGDADTIGAICGQIAGAFWGYKSILASAAGRVMVANTQTWDPKREIPLRAIMLYRLSSLN